MKRNEEPYEVCAPCPHCGRGFHGTCSCTPEERAAYREELAQTREEFVRLWPTVKTQLPAMAGAERAEVLDRLRQLFEGESPMVATLEYAEDPAFAGVMQELRALSRELLGESDPKSAS